MQTISLKRILIATFAVLLIGVVAIFVLRVFKVPVLPNSYCALYQYGYDQYGKFNNFCPLGCVIKKVIYECPKGALCSAPPAEGFKDCLGF